MGQVLQAQHWESKESWISSTGRRRLTGESRGRSSQGPGNGLFQGGAKLGLVGKMTERAGVWGAQPAASTAVCLGDPQSLMGLLAINVHPVAGCS